ncbi:hypothetical protein SLS63_003532 [Diaporthe eres]|uniref:Uncharacterized protein n=1 Tax=Diaporthe eres TaxID=83184 RepID=A0ABR1PGL8_DIAER
MRGPPQPKSRTQGKSDHDSRPDSDQKTTGNQDDESDISIPIRQILDRQEVGKFDFDLDFGIIKNEYEFKHRLKEYEAMNNDPRSCTDFPTDPKTRREFALKIGKAIVNLDGARDATIKNTVRKDRLSQSVTHLNRLKTTEVEIMSWKVMFAAYNAQSGEMRWGTWGRDDIRRRPERYKSWTERIEKIIEVLNYKDKQSAETAQKPPSGVFKTSSSRSTTTQNAPSTPRLSASASASPTTESKAEQRSDPSTSNDITPDSVDGGFSSPVIPTRPSSTDNQRPGQSSPAAASGLSAFTNSSPSPTKPLPSSPPRSDPRRQLPSSAPQTPQASSFPSSPGGAPSQGGTAGASDTQSSANKRSCLSSEPQEDHSPGTRGAGASRGPKRPKWYTIMVGSDLNADDVEREENDDHDNKQEE